MEGLLFGRISRDVFKYATTSLGEIVIKEALQSDSMIAISKEAVSA